jgi:hypothetical protein
MPPALFIYLPNSLTVLLRPAYGQFSPRAGMTGRHHHTQLLSEMGS